jgi:glycosyltransferase involved in cell wall biosynthesis
MRSEARIAHALIAADTSCDRKLILLAEARYLGLRTIAHFHGSTLVEWLDGLSPRHRGRVMSMTNHCSAIVVLGSRVADSLRRHGLRRDVHVIPNGVEPATQRQVNPAEPQTVLFVGKLGARKGTPDLLRSFQALSARHPRATLVLMGDGDVEATRRLASALGIGDRVVCTGWRDEHTVHEHMERATVFVLPSYHENMSLSVLEAMMRGLPVITTPVGEHRSVIEDGRDALFVAPGDIDALRNAIERVLRDPILAAALGSAARERARRDFCVSRNHQRIAEVYDSLVDTRKARAAHR